MKLSLRAAAICVFSLASVFSANHPAVGEPKNDSKTSISYNTVLLQALSQSPLVKEIDAALAARLAESLETGLHLNPQLEMGVGLPAAPTGDADKPQIALTLSQPLRATDFGARQAVADLLAEAADVEQKLAVLEFSQSLYLAYTKLWVLQEQRASLNEQRDRARRVSDKVNAAASKGALSKGEGGLFTAEYKKLGAQLLGIEADSAREKAKLLQLSGFAVGEGVIESPPKFFPRTTSESLLHNLGEQGLPIQSRYALLAKVTAEREKLARRDAFPAVSPQISYERTEDGGSFIGLGVQFALPVFDRNQPEILRRQGEASAAAAKTAYAQSAAFSAEIGHYLQSIEALQKQAETYEKEVIPSLSTVLNSYEQQFQTGSGGVLSLWQAERELSNAQLEALELWTRFFASRSDLAILIGQEL